MGSPSILHGLPNRPVSAMPGAEFAIIAPARCIGLFGESPALPERRRRKFPPGNAQATGRQTLDAMSSDSASQADSGEWCPSISGSPTEGERRETGA